MFDYKMEVNEKELKIVIIGEFDTPAALKVQEDLLTYKDKPLEKIHFDLKEATLIASSGLRVMIVAKDQLKENMIVEVTGASGLVAKVIKMSGISTYINIIE